MNRKIAYICNNIAKCMSELLKKKNIRVTDFRLQVLDLFTANEYAISIHTIEQNLASFDRITLYRTLKTFVAKGVLHEIVIPNEKKYALCNEQCSSEEHQHQHIHFKCNACNEIFCKEVDELPQVTIPGFSVQNIELNATGVCNNCLS